LGKLAPDVKSAKTLNTFKIMIAWYDKVSLMATSAVRSALHLNTILSILAISRMKHQIVRAPELLLVFKYIISPFCH